MATQNKRRSQNIVGNFYVDSTCIDCDTCRWMAPEVFYEVDGQSAVYHQPTGEIEQKKALQALLSCPTASIGTVEKPKDIKTIHATFPIAIEENVFHCGYHSEASFAAASYLIQHPDGNILIDSPRFAPPLVKQIEAMGGIRWLYLTHKDDVADHQKYHDHFNCDRILHQDDISAKLQGIEIKLTGHQVFNLTEDIIIIPVPGHTKGHTVLLYKNKFLFTGDHLCWSRHLEQLIGFKNFCWYSWPELIKSMESLTNYDFEWVLPGHGRRYHADVETMHKELEKCLTWMKK
ncbi:beta-lactamase domain protein [Rippkaea orientalis PCC 8801]|uniref:Beta-lactamase domain protein n=1 Tax=Rippkaea orientalis (strain PCC 8801 / RF-1) TaxID=41431 RepID=B7JZY6_RIPO1|nr:MBL fold metallo-hydrolase [Rippkaea orientalis]ACK66133.1 beta-lactamase domain protein [Rippkaea orientalis PCC 8801]